MDTVDGGLNILDRVGLYRNFDEARQNDLENLVSKFQQMSSELNTLRADIEDEQYNRRKWRQRAETAEMAITRNQFVLVLVDGDGYIFNNAFLRHANDCGGAQAAHELYTEIQNYLKVNLLVDSEIEVMVNVYANRVGLAKSLCDAGIFHSPAQLDQFFCSFSQSHSLFQFIDCGQGKEVTDAKLRDTYRFYAYNAHCRNIFLACCHDNGYVAEFHKYRHDPIATPKTILVQATQLGRQYSTLSFPVARLGSVFETTPLQPVRRIDPYQNGLLVMSQVPQLSQIPQLPQTSTSTTTVDEASSPASHEETSSTGATSYSSITAGPATIVPIRGGGTITSPSTKTASIEAVKPAVLNKPAGELSGIPINRSGQRIDRRMRQPSLAQQERFDNRISKRKLCNSHHLSQAGCYSNGCKFDHERIDEAMRNTLRYKARSIPCGSGMKCRKLDCFYGHQCPWGNTNCSNPKCVFVKSGMHDITDLEIAKFVPAAPA